MKRSTARKIFLIGAGGHGRVVLEALLSSDVKITGILDPGLRAGGKVFGVPILGGDDYLEDVMPADVQLVNGLGANPDVHTRRNLFTRMKDRGFSFLSVRHPSAIVGYECEFGEGAEVMAGAVLQNRVKVRDNAVINTRASIDHDCVIGQHSFVSPGAVLSGDVSVAASTFVGAGAVLLPGIEIGEMAVVGAGAVVTKNVSRKWVVAGNPAAKIGTND